MSRHTANRAKWDLGDGNTNIPKSQGIQSKHWCFTFNNYPENLEQFEQDISCFTCKWIYGKEIGDSGTKHLQGYFETKIKKRFENIKSVLLKNYPTIHLERTRNIECSIEYCKKDGNFKQKGFPKQYTGKDLPTKDMLYPWQLSLLEIWKTEADCRKVIWIYDTKGLSGKSKFSKYMMYHHNISGWEKNKYGDIMNLAYNSPLENLEVIIFDLIRSEGNEICYGALESLKNGKIVNSKYETGIKLFDPPHICVLANFPPIIENLSDDRWIIYTINKNRELVQEDRYGNPIVDDPLES